MAGSKTRRARRRLKKIGLPPPRQPRPPRGKYRVVPGGKEYERGYDRVEIRRPKRPARTPRNKPSAAQIAARKAGAERFAAMRSGRAPSQRVTGSPRAAARAFAQGEVNTPPLKAYLPLDRRRNQADDQIREQIRKFEINRSINRRVLPPFKTNPLKPFDFLV